ncbi:MAG: YkgJ family cysteine cluster protein [Candidatus Korobacteraceae bacterium]
MPETPVTPERILQETPRMNLDTCFNFACGPGKDCFNSCCRDVAILLSPYDVLRLKRALGMDSSQFLEQYTLTTCSQEKRVPAVLLKMDEHSLKCPLVTEKGCKVYSNRPWACRMYPLGMAEPKGPNATAQRFYFLLKEELCHGHGADKPCSVRDWIEKQGIESFERMQTPFLEFMSHPGWEKPELLSAESLAMYYMALYDLDRFRRFVFDTRFLELFEVDEARIEAMANDDEELLEFAIEWLAFSLFHEKRMRLRKPCGATQPAVSAETSAQPGSPA